MVYVELNQGIYEPPGSAWCKSEWRSGIHGRLGPGILKIFSPRLSWSEISHCSLVRVRSLVSWFWTNRFWSVDSLSIELRSRLLGQLEIRDCLVETVKKKKSRLWLVVCVLTRTCLIFEKSYKLLNHFAH